MNKNNMYLIPNVIRTFGLIPYMFHYLRKESIISYIVVNNGIYYHLIFNNNPLMKWFDILCNFTMILYINNSVMDVFVFMWSCIACACFIWNSLYIKHELSKAIIHVLGVQLPLYKALTLTDF